LEYTWAKIMDEYVRVKNINTLLSNKCFD